MKILGIKIISILAIIILISFYKTNQLYSQEICNVPFIDNGALELVVNNPASLGFVGALLGTYDKKNSGEVHGGMDWFFSDFLAQDRLGSQLIGFISQVGGRNTKIQVTNHHTTAVTIHATVHYNNCSLDVDFFDTFTQGDTHVYDFSSLFFNTGTPIPINLTGQEGVIVITPVANLSTDPRAIHFPFLDGRIKMSDSTNNIDYGVSLWKRSASSTGCTSTNSAGFKILDGTGGTCRFLPADSFGLTQIEMTKGFSTIPLSNASRADVILLSISDNYTISDYEPIPGVANFSEIGIYDLDENFLSCAPLSNTCYQRLGINQELPNSDNPLNQGQCLTNCNDECQTNFSDCRIVCKSVSGRTRAICMTDCRDARTACRDSCQSICLP